MESMSAVQTALQRVLKSDLRTEMQTVAKMADRWALPTAVLRERSTEAQLAVLSATRTA